MEKRKKYSEDKIKEVLEKLQNTYKILEEKESNKKGMSKGFFFNTKRLIMFANKMGEDLCTEDNYSLGFEILYQTESICDLFITVFANNLDTSKVRPVFESTDTETPHNQHSIMTHSSSNFNITANPYTPVVRLLAITTYNIGLLHLHTDAFEKAYNFLFKSLKLQKKLGYSNIYISYTLLNLSIVFSSK